MFQTCKHMEKYDELLKSLYSSDDPNEAFHSLLVEYENSSQQFFEIMVFIFNSEDKEKVIRKEVLFVIKNIISHYEVDLNQFFEILVHFISPDIEFHDLIVNMFFEFCIKKNSQQPDEPIFQYELSDENILPSLIILESYSHFLLSSKIQIQYNFFLQYSHDFLLHMLDLFSQNQDSPDLIYIVTKILYNIINVNSTYPLLDPDFIQICLNFVKNNIVTFQQFADKPYFDDLFFCEMKIFSHSLYIEQIRENGEIYQFIFDSIFTNDFFREKQIYCSSFCIIQTLLEKTTIFKENEQIFFDYLNGIFVPFLTSYISSIDCFNDDVQSDETSFFGSSLLYEDVIHTYDSCWKNPLDAAKIICGNLSRFPGAPDNLNEFIISCIESIQIDANTITATNVSSQISDGEKSVIVYYWILGLSKYVRENIFLKTESSLCSEAYSRIIGSLICIYQIACENNITNSLCSDFFDFDIVNAIFQFMEQDDDQIIKIVAERTFHNVIGECDRNILDQLEYDPTSIIQSFLQDSTDLSIINSIKTVFEVFPERVIELSKDDLLEQSISSLATCISCGYFEQTSILTSLVIKILKYIDKDEFFSHFCAQTIAFIQSQLEQSVEAVASNPNNLISTWLEITEYIFKFNTEEIHNAAVQLIHIIYPLVLDESYTLISLQEIQTSLRNLILSSSSNLSDFESILGSIIQNLQEITETESPARALDIFEIYSELLASFYFSNFGYTQSIVNIVEILSNFATHDLLDHCFYLISSLIYNNPNPQENILNCFDIEIRKAIIDAWIRYDNGFIPFTASFMRGFLCFSQEEQEEITAYINQDIYIETNTEEEDDFTSEIRSDWSCFNISFEDTVQQFRMFLTNINSQKQGDENILV